MINTNSSASSVRHFFRHVAQRELALPFLCFIAGHRPLAFTAGQLLYVLEPLAGLLGQAGIRRWAAWLSDPAGTASLLQTLSSPSPDLRELPITQPPQTSHDHGLA